MPELAISSWSLHRELGPTYKEPKEPGGPREAEYPYGRGSLSLLELPDRLRDFDVRNLEICHFHFPRTDAEYLASLRRSLEAAGVEFLTLLIDAGDLTAPDEAKRQEDLAWIRGWIDVAAAAGARRARVIAGHAEPDSQGRAMDLSVQGLVALSEYARERGVRIITENWFALTMQPHALLQILDRLHGTLGLCADFGNYRGEDKYQRLEAILPRATSIHAKCSFTAPGEPELDDFRRCLDLSRQAGFGGQYVLIFDSAGEEWPSLALMKDIVGEYLVDS